MNKTITTEEMAQSALQTLRNMLGIEATVKSISEGPPHQTVCDISAVLTLSSARFSGTLTLHTNAKLANRLAGAMLGDEKFLNSVELNDEIRDAMGEFANIVVGSFKPVISTAVGEPVRMSVPTVVVGKHHITQTISGGQWSEARIDIDGEELVIEIIVSEDSAA